MISKDQKRHSATKSTEATVFVKFTPPSTLVTRQVLEQWFGDIGPIRKCAVIRESQRHSKGSNSYKESEQQNQVSSDTSNKGYGFVKFVSASDAQLAVDKLHRSTQNLLSNHNHESNKVEKESIKVKLIVDLATTVHDNPDRRNQQRQKKDAIELPSKQGTSGSTKQLGTTHQQHEVETENEDEDELTKILAKKKKNRVIVRNLSFYAKEQHVREVLEARFGKIVDIHLPRIVQQPTLQDTSKKPKKQKLVHRGFCFVTFDTISSAKQAVQDASSSTTNPSKPESSIIIHNRPVQIEWSVSKHVHDERQLEQSQGKEGKVSCNDGPDDTADNILEEMEKSSDKGDNAKLSHDEDEEVDDDVDEDNEHSFSDKDSNEDENSLDDEDNDEATESSQQKTIESKESNFRDISDQPDTAVTHHCSVFVRNLPFDASRHDLFETFRSFGRITSIYLVKDKETGAPKGTAFVTFQDANGAQRALVKSGGDKYSDNGNMISEEGLFLQGRRLVVHLAVDRDTASTIAMDKSSNAPQANRGKDRRNLYLQSAGRVHRSDAKSDQETSAGNSWDDLPESDQQKRQRAFADTSTKLKSPLFFINPNRLSIRNLAKHINESDMKQLCALATKRGLTNGVVSVDDQVAHWRAQGELSSRDMLQLLQQEDSIIPEFNEKNIKQFIPSVFIDRDFESSTKTAGASRGFGFIEFQHHVHAMACLRELNNNTAYTEEYVAGGRKAMQEARSQRKRQKGKRKHLDGNNEIVKLPRLVVEFTVENKAKAKQQALHRAQQKANHEKQKLEYVQGNSRNTTETLKSNKHRSRGAAQRQRKRLRRDSSERNDLESIHDGSQRERQVLNDQLSSENSMKSGIGKVENVEEDTEVKNIKIKTTSKPPKKKQKMNMDDVAFDHLVDSYRKVFEEATQKSEASKSIGRGRWFE